MTTLVVAQARSPWHDLPQLTAKSLVSAACLLPAAHPELPAPYGGPRRLHVGQASFGVCGSYSKQPSTESRWGFNALEDTHA